MTDESTVEKSRYEEHLSQHQVNAAQQIRARLERGSRSVTFGGLAGTGKTTVAGHLPEILGIDPQGVAFCAFTGKAASVLNKKFPDLGATTIHGLIYRAIERHCDQCPARFRQNEEKPGAAMAYCHSADCPECRIQFVLREKLPRDLRLIVVDEASMVPGVLYDHLQTYNVPIVWIGDHGQLPPVKSAFNVVEDPDIKLEKIHRHAAGSPILRLAMHVRNTGQLPKTGRYGPDVVVRRGGYFQSNAAEWAAGSLIAVCATNSQRMAVNRAARKAQKFGQDPTIGDRVVCLRNSTRSMIFNGLTGTVLDVHESFHDPGYYLSVQLDGEDRVYVGLASSDQFGTERTLYEMPKNMNLWGYGYGLTVHKAQGSEYERVVVVCDFARTSNRIRWLYTAITRATEKLEIIYPE